MYGGSGLKNIPARMMKRMTAGRRARRGAKVRAVVTCIGSVTVGPGWGVTVRVAITCRGVAAHVEIESKV